MLKLFGPGLLIAAALALPLFADTGGAASATLYIVASPTAGPAGGAGALTEGCLPSLIPIPPPLVVEQNIELFHDVDGDGLLDPGDMISYSAEIRSFYPEPLEGLRLLVIFPRDFVPMALSGEWEPVELGRVSAMTVGLPTLLFSDEAKVGFAALFLGNGNETMPETFVSGFVYSDGFGIAADDPTTTVFLDPAVAAVKEVAGSAGSLFLDSSVFSKRASVPSDYPRLVEEGEEVEFEIVYTPLVEERDLELLDLVPAPLRLIPDSIDSKAVDFIDLGGVTVLRARFRDVRPGERVVLRYRTVVENPVKVPYIATHALALSSGGIVFSDDPLTPAEGDPTAVLFTWRNGEPGPSWDEVFRSGRYSIPVILRQKDGNEVLRWAVCSSLEPVEEHPGNPRFLMVQVPVKSLPQGSLLGFLLSRMPDLEVGEVYVPEAYGMPVFSPLAGDVGFVEELPSRFCGHLYLPVVVKLPEGIQPHLTGVIADEGI